MSEKARFSIASEGVRFAIAAAITVVLIAVYHFVSNDSGAQRGQVSASASPTAATTDPGSVYLTPRPIRRPDAN